MMKVLLYGSLAPLLVLAACSKGSVVASNARTGKSDAVKTEGRGPHRITGRMPDNMRVAFVISDSATVIDFAGPWEVFQDTMMYTDKGEMVEPMVMPFELYTVSDTREPIEATDGMKIIPNYTFDDAPAPRIVVVGAQSGHSPKMMEWLRKRSQDSDVVMSVCTGAFKLGDAGLLSGKKATTHYLFFDSFAKKFPDVSLQKGKRYVQSDAVVFTAGGLTSGIDLALHIVELYFGNVVAEKTAEYMEYQGRGWQQ